MYATSQDPYCYPDSAVLKNSRGIRDLVKLEIFELAMTNQRSDEPFPPGRFGVTHYRNIHRHLFQDIYTWAGKFRTVRLFKEGSAFCYPEHIGHEMKTLFQSLHTKHALTGLKHADFAAEAASFLATLNAIHPFREGNGRAQVSFLTSLAAYAGHPVDTGRLQPKPFLSAMVASFKGDEGPLLRQIARLTK